VKFSDKLFYFLQAFFINFEFNIFDKIRVFLYRPFFKKLGYGTRICSGVHFKYPSQIKIGNFCYLGKGTIVAGLGGIVIGDYALIGAHVKICSGTHVAADIDKPICFQGLRKKSINIGSDVWIGFDCTVLLGSKIGDHSIIGANSVILEDSDFSDYSIIAGTPASLKGKRNA
jgi:maltose O-acetyltransferase